MKKMRSILFKTAGVLLKILSILAICLLYMEIWNTCNLWVEGVGLKNIPHMVQLWEVVQFIIIPAGFLLAINIFVKTIRRYFLMIVNIIASTVLFFTLLQGSFGSLVGDDLKILTVQTPLIIIPFAVLFTIDFSLKKSLKVILIVLNLIALAIIGGTYFYGFDLQWGFNKTAFTWGLPLLIGFFIVISGIFFSLKNNKWVAGIASLFVGVLVIVYFQVLISTVDIAVLDEPAPPQANISLNEEEKILTLILANLDQENDRNGFTVVNPIAKIACVDYMDSQEVEVFKNELKEYQNYSKPMSDLIDKLFELNKEPTILNLSSNLEAGYFIDKKRKFLRYINKDPERGMGEPDTSMVRWDRYHPLANGPLQVSIPAYDRDTGVVILSITGTEEFGGTLNPFFIYKYKDGNLEKVGSLPNHFDSIHIDSHCLNYL
jgi:hypothetical protein